MPAFEYRLLSLEQDPHAFEAQLNRLGPTGWEAVGEVSCIDDDESGVGPERVRYLLLKRRVLDDAGGTSSEQRHLAPVQG